MTMPMIKSTCSQRIPSSVVAESTAPIALAETKEETNASQKQSQKKASKKQRQKKGFAEAE
jgi:hypothetical protein